MCDCEDREPIIPFTESVDGDVHVRTFPMDTDPRDLVWHWDPEDRQVSAEEPNGWKLQLDDQLPIEFPIEPFVIPAGVYHRVIAGHGPLVVRVKKQ